MKQSGGNAHLAFESGEAGEVETAVAYEELTAPVTRGDVIGQVTCTVDGSVRAQVDITAGEDVAQVSFFRGALPPGAGIVQPSKGHKGARGELFRKACPINLQIAPSYCRIEAQRAAHPVFGKGACPFSRFVACREKTPFPPGQRLKNQQGGLLQCR